MCWFSTFNLFEFCFSLWFQSIYNIFCQIMFINCWYRNTRFNFVSSDISLYFFNNVCSKRSLLNFFCNFNSINYNTCEFSKASIIISCITEICSHWFINSHSNLNQVISFIFGIFSKSINHLTNSIHCNYEISSRNIFHNLICNFFYNSFYFKFSFQNCTFIIFRLNFINKFSVDFVWRYYFSINLEVVVCECTICNRYNIWWFSFWAMFNIFQIIFCIHILFIEVTFFCCKLFVFIFLVFIRIEINLMFTIVSSS